MKNKLNWLEAALLIAPFVVLAATWNKLPARFPAHWNASGEIDRWTSNRAEVLILPVIMLAVVALLHALPSFDPRLRKTLQSPDRMHTVLRVFFFGARGVLRRNFRAPDGDRVWLLCLGRATGDRLHAGAARRDRQLSGQLAPELFCRHPHAVDSRKSGDLARDSSSRRAADLFRRASPPGAPVRAQPGRVSDSLRQFDSAAGRVGVRIFVASLSNPCGVARALIQRRTARVCETR